MKGGDRKSKSIAELKSSGTFRPDRHAGRAENHVEPVKTLPPPSDFPAEHKAVWNKSVDLLTEIRLLTKQDYDIMRVYVETFIQQRRAWDVRMKEGDFVTVEVRGQLVQQIHPAVKVYESSEKILKAIRYQFGFNPRARQGLQVGKPDTKKADPMLDILMGKKKTA